ncbi:hypothetical protein KY348_00860 [Candidatus Woesearchaeota archaeon]|nr:hypothetical protein [Candidatus Woesearchaeota archaeon]
MIDKNYISRLAKKAKLFDYSILGVREIKRTELVKSKIHRDRIKCFLEDMIMNENSNTYLYIKGPVEGTYGRSFEKGSYESINIHLNSPRLNLVNNRMKVYETNPVKKDKENYFAFTFSPERLEVLRQTKVIDKQGPYINVDVDDLLHPFISLFDYAEVPEKSLYLTLGPGSLVHEIYLPDKVTRSYLSQQNRIEKALEKLGFSAKILPSNNLEPLAYPMYEATDKVTGTRMVFQNDVTDIGGGLRDCHVVDGTFYFKNPVKREELVELEKKDEEKEGRLWKDKKISYDSIRITLPEQEETKQVTIEFPELEEQIPVILRLAKKANQK